MSSAILFSSEMNSVIKGRWVAGEQVSQELGMLKGRTMDLLPGEIPERPLAGTG